MKLGHLRTLSLSVLLTAMVGLCMGQTNPAAAVPADQSFAPFEKWKSLVLAGDAAGLKQLYSTNPVAHIITASGSVDADAAVHYWVGIKARDMKVEIVQNLSPQPDSQQLAFQAEILSAATDPEKTFYITEVQLWQKVGQDWRLVVSKRTDASRLQQPVTAKKNIYDAKADAHATIKDALAKAVKEHKRVLLVFGANWCYDCHVLDLAFERPDIAPILETNYVVAHIDTGQGDKNQDLMQQYDVPPERGIPAAAVLDANGKLLYSQKRGEFEKARELGPEDLLAFLNKWRSGAGKS
jgi:thioredoxin 1